MTDSCVIYQHIIAGNGRLLSATDQASDSERGIRWSHIEYTRPDALEWLIAEGVPEAAAETMARVETRPRTFTFETGTLINLRAVNLNPDADPEDMVSVRLWLEKGRIISARQRRIMSLQDMLEEFSRGRGPKTEGKFLVTLVEHLASRIGEAVDHVEDLVEGYEEEPSDLAQACAELSQVRRKTAALRRFLAPQREALEGMYRVKQDWLDDSDAHYLREQADRITRYVEDLDLNRERALVLQEELQHRVAQEQNSRAFLLTIVATIFLPLSFLTGVFGMNVAGLPGTEDVNAFRNLSIAMGASGLLIVLFMRVKRWF